MNRKPRLLDLFCGAGGASVGYARAGFEVVGVDINPQKNYPFEFHKADALDYPCDGFDAIHASPPCQRFSAMSNCRPGLSAEYPDLIAAIRCRIAGRPYVIENVEGSNLHRPTMLCGTMFGLELYRHRIFESNAALPDTEWMHGGHSLPASKAGHWRPGTVMSVAGHVSPIAKAREVMGIDWMTRDELAQAIPPAYTEWVRGQILNALRAAD